MSYESFFESFYSHNSKENEHTENIFYLNLKHVHKYGSAKFQPNPLFSSQQMSTEYGGGRKKKKKKKVGKPIGDPVGTGCPNYWGNITQNLWFCVLKMVNIFRMV